MDVIQTIERDHREVERLFERFERAARAGDAEEQAHLARAITRELSVHAAVEEQVVYPALLRAGAGSERLEALEDHHAVKVALAELAAMSPRQERFAAKVRMVARSVRRHVEEEEAALLPRLRDALDPDALRRLGAEVDGLRRWAPTRPHPAAPDTPPANVVADAAAALTDRLRDALAGAADLLRAIAHHLVERALRAGRDAAVRARHEGEAAVGQARARGEHAVREVRRRAGRAVEDAQARGAVALQTVAGEGAAVADRVEHRSAAAARELRREQRAAGARGRRPARKAPRRRRR